MTQHIETVLVPFLGRARLVPSPPPREAFDDARETMLTAFGRLVEADLSAARWAVAEVVTEMMAALRTDDDA